MSKTVQIDDLRAQRLEQLAKQQGVSESELIAQALDALFTPMRTPAERELWQQIEAEFGPLPPYQIGTPLDPTAIASFVGTPLDPATVRRPEESC